METGPINYRKNKPFKKVLSWFFLVLMIFLVITGFYLYRNFNRILSDSLMKSFNSNVISDVYELKFEKLRVNFFTGNIIVFNVILQPRKTPLRNYTYINSSFKLETRKIHLEDIHLVKLIKSGKLNLKSIEIHRPSIEIELSGEKYILLPYADTTEVSDTSNKNNEKFVSSFFLEQFELVDASFQIINITKQTKFRVQNLDISLNELKLNQKSGKNLFLVNNAGLNIGDIYGRMQKGALRSLNVKDFNLAVQQLDIQETPDTFIFHFSQIETMLKNLDINTSDSIFNLSVNSIALSYAKKSLNLKDISYKPNISRKALLEKDKYQKWLFSLSAGKIDLINVDFDTLFHRQKLFIDDINVDTVDISVFKDKTKPVDTTRFPQYPGQSISAIPVPLMIKRVSVTGVNVESTERKVDGNLAIVEINRGNLEVKNITNLQLADYLSVQASAYLENKVRFNVDVDFSYQKPLINFNANAGKFNFTDLNKLLTAYTPAKIKNGTVDEITFSGTADRTSAKGTMKALFHNMDIDLEIADKKWVNSFLTFSANSIAISNNPPSDDKPPRIVNYHVERNMNKGFFNIFLKSLLTGTKETFIMSKENKKTYKEDKKKWKEQRN